MLERVVLHDAHDGNYADAVVRPERCAFGMHPSVLDVGLDGVGLEVVLAVGSLLWHHVHVCLQHDGLAVLKAGSGGLAHHDVAGRVLKGLHANALGEVEEELLYFL